MKNCIILIFLIISTLKANEKVTLQLNWKHQFQFAGYYMAKELGYYKSSGIDLEIKEFKYPIDTVESVLSGDSQFAVGRSSIIIDKSNGKDIVALSAIYQNSPLMLLVKANSGIKKLEDLKNKRIMITNNAKASASIMAMLYSNDISKEDIKIQSHSFNINDLIEDKTDAMASYISNEPIILESKNIKYKIFHPKDYGFNFYDDILFTSSKFLNDNPELVKKFYEATIKGWRYAFNNIGRTAEVVYKKYNSQNKSIISLVKEAEVLKKLIHHNGSNEIGCLDEEIIKNILQTYKVLGLAKNDFNTDDFIYEFNPHRYIEFKLEHSEAILFGIIIFLVLIVFILIVFYLVVKSKMLHTNNELKQEINTATSKLKYKKKLIEHYLDNISLLFVVIDKSGNIENINQSTAKLLGGLQKDLIGLNWFENFLYDDDIESTKKYFQNTVLGEEKNTSYHENKIISKDGKIYTIAWYNSIIKDENGKFIRSISTGIDISKQIELEKKIDEQNKIILTQSRVAAAGEMIGNIAHQWRQPLSVISTHTTSIIVDVELGNKIENDKLVLSMESINEQCQYLSQTIDDFRSFLKENNDDQKEIYLSKTINKIEKLVYDSLHNSNIKLIKNIDDIKVVLNESVLIQSLLNIINNAKDAIVLNEINENDRFIFIDAKIVNDQLSISVKDNGNGIKDKIYEKIFEPYTTTKHKSKGTGIGLYMTYQIISNTLKGTISVKNTKYEYNGKSFKGAKFDILVPLQNL